MISIFGIAGATISSVARTFFNRPGKRALAAATADPLLQERLDRLESAIQAIAIQTERIADGQRFTTQLLSHSAALPASGPSGGAFPGPVADRVGM